MNFKFDHLGIGRITGDFREFGGTFFYDPQDVSLSWVKVTIDTASLDSNQSVRDANIRSSLFLDVEQFPLARFESSSVAMLEDGTMSFLSSHKVVMELYIERVQKP